MGFLDRFLDPPGDATTIERRNFHVAYRESALIGFISAAGAFLPVFVARLGGSNLEVSLITALPSVIGAVIAIPIGGLMQARRNVIPWYARGRLGGHLGYVGIGCTALLLPAALVVPGILAVWVVVTFFSVVTSVAFNVVMDETAGRRGRYELMSRRWSIMGLTAAFGLVVVGQALGWLPFPMNYEAMFVAMGLLGFVSYRYASAIRVPDHPPAAVAAVAAPRARAFAGTTGVVARVRAQPGFGAFALRHFLFAAGTSIAVPLVPLFYVRVIGASDGWIGIIGTTQSLALLVGYTVWRRAGRRYGPQFVLTWSTIGAAISPAALALVRDPLPAAVIAGLGAIFTAGINLALFDRLMSIVPAGFGVTFSSVDTQIVYVAGVVGPLVAAVLADWLGLESALLLAGLATLLGALLFTIDRLPRARSRATAGARAISRVADDADGARSS